MPRVVGIDWATEPKNRALVALDVAADFMKCSVMEVAPRVEDSAVHQACTNGEHAVVAIDIPFGWPSSFAAFVSRGARPTKCTSAPRTACPTNSSSRGGRPANAGSP
jgi:hypothetical protein